MKTFSKFLLAAALTVGASAGLTSCHDHDEVCSDGTGNTEQLNYNFGATQALRHILLNTTALDSVPSNWASSSFSAEPNVGDVTDQSNRRVRTVVASCTDEAIDFYKLITNQDGSTYSPTWYRDSIGTITLNADSTENCYGTINFNVRQLNLDQIRFVPASALGSNFSFSNWTPHYHFGDVIRVTKKNANPENGDKPEYWICVRGEFSEKGTISSVKIAHWVNFRLDSIENVEHLNGDIVIDSPKKLNGENDYLKTLPVLLRIICNPQTTWNEWESVANDKTYKGKCFFGAGQPYPKNYFYENDFIRISNNINTAFNKLGGLKTLIPALGADDGNELLAHIYNGNPLVLLSDDVYYPRWKIKTYNPPTFTELRKYSDKFYQTYTKTNASHDFSMTMNSFNILKLAESPYYYSQNYFKGLWEELTGVKDRSVRLLVVRQKGADDFAGIQNAKNYGQPYTSTELDFEDIVLDTYEDPTTGHKSQTYQVACTDPYLPGEVGNSATFTENKNALCLGVDADGTEVFIRDGEVKNKTLTKYNITPNKETATRILLNVLNGFCIEKGVDIVGIYTGWNSTQDWSAYNTAVTRMRENCNKISATEKVTGLIDSYFKTSALGNVYSASMNYVETVEGESTTKSIKMTYDSDKKEYYITTSTEPIELANKYTLCTYFNKAVQRASFTRTYTVGQYSILREALKKLNPVIYSTASTHIHEKK